MFRPQEIIECINEKLKATWSPEQISCTPCDLKMPSWRTIYLWIYEKYLVNWRRIEQQLGCEVYFADPCCAWQKGTHENSNGLLREFYPKSRNLSRIAPAALKRSLALINARPRKVFNFRSAQDLWDFELNSCCTRFDNWLCLLLLDKCTHKYRHIAFYFTFWNCF